MMLAPWAGPRRMQQAARKSGLQGVCTFKRRIPNSQEQEEQHSLTAAIPHCLATLTKLTAFKLSQQTSLHLQIIIWMLNNQYQAKSLSRQGQQSCLCVPVDSGGKTHHRENHPGIAEPARTGSTPLGAPGKTPLRKITVNFSPEMYIKFSGCNSCNSPQPPVTAEQQHCSAGESPKLLYTTEAENCSPWMHLLNYNPHQGFQQFPTSFKQRSPNFLWQWNGETLAKQF